MINKIFKIKPLWFEDYEYIIKKLEQRNKEKEYIEQLQKYY